MTDFWIKIKLLSTLQKATILLSLITLIISFTQPAFFIDRPENPAAWAESWILFFFGWTFLLGGATIPVLIWLANPIYIYSIILTVKGEIGGLYLSCLATSIAFSFSQLDSIMTSESGSYSAITSLELGYKFWLTGFAIMSIGTGIDQYLKKKNKDRL